MKIYSIKEQFGDLKISDDIQRLNEIINTDSEVIDEEQMEKNKEWNELSNKNFGS